MKLSTKIILPIILIPALLILLTGCFTAPPSTYTVTYCGNDNTGGTVPIDANLYEEGAAVTVLGNTGNLEKTDFDFAGWNTAADGSGTDQTAGFTMGAADVILYARWTINTYTASFNSRGGSAVASQTVVYGGKVTEPTAPTRTGYTFAGWYKESECTNAWDFATNTVTSDVTLYAKWTPLYALRDTGPAGGLIFYVKEGGYSGGWIYLEAAPIDQSASQAWSNITDVAVGTSAQGTVIGTGQTNTTAIIGQTGHAASAAGLARAYDEGGYSDWFLPSKDELDLMHKNLYLFTVGGFADGWYWSSSEDDAGSAGA